MRSRLRAALRRRFPSLLPVVLLLTAAALPYLERAAGGAVVMVGSLAGRTPVPEKEALASLAAHQTTMAIYLSTGMIDQPVQHRFLLLAERSDKALHDVRVQRCQALLQHFGHLIRV